ncbi:MAG: FAD-binding oxidoreductase [Actinomycetota bacterium]|nr:FAD-binding oxidoreductase [Actinomycetota bacterium]
MERRLKHWGWGYEDEQLAPEAQREAARFISSRLGFGSTEPELPAPLPSLPAPRLKPPKGLAEICPAGDYERALHAYGRSYADVVRAFRGQFDHPPDVVAYPRDEAEVSAVLDWALSAGAAMIPFGGGTSVVGGVEPRVGDGYRGVVTLDLKALDRVLEIDEVSRAARIQAGATGPLLESQLAARGLTLRHFPQSFQFSTLGGWIATRAGGHFATLYTHIDDLVESVRALTPSGVWESRRLPGSGAGISPDRMLIGSEGTLGVITEAWVRVRPRPVHRASAGVRFAEFSAGAAAVRALSQSGLYPTNCRLIDAAEALLTGAGDGSHALLVIGFESPEYDIEPWMTLALECCSEHGGLWERRGASAPAQAPDSGSVGSWRDAFLRAPYLRDTFVAIGVLSETFETAITWERFPAFHASVTEQVSRALHEVCGGGSVTCRLTHVYPDGPAPYYTMLAPARRGGELEQWAALKRVAGDAVIAGGGTITHHHAIGRDHRPWYDQQRPDVFAAALSAAKAAVDPGWALNPGVLIDQPAQL